MVRKLVGALLLVALFATLACSAPQAGQPAQSGQSGKSTQSNQKDIVFGVTVPLTGQYSDQGKTIQNAFKVWEKQVNAKGGLLGRKVRVAIYDDRSDPATAVNLYENMLSVEKVDFILGSMAGNIIERASTLAEQNKRLFIQGNAPPESLFNRGYKYFFLSAPGSAEKLAGVFFGWLDALPADKRPKTVSIIWQDNVSMEGTAKGARALSKKNGLDVVFEEKYPPGITDVNPIISKLKAKNPDVVYQAGFYPDSMLIARALNQQAANAKFVLLQCPAAGYPNFGPDLGPASEGVYTACWWNDSVNYPGSKEFVAAYKAEFGNVPTFNSANSYSSLQIYEQAIEATKSLDQDVLRDYVSKNTFQTVDGPISFDEKGLPKETRILVIQWQGGKPVILSPKEQATGEAKIR